MAKAPASQTRAAKPALCTFSTTTVAMTTRMRPNMWPIPLLCHSAQTTRFASPMPQKLRATSYSTPRAKGYAQVAVGRKPKSTRCNYGTSPPSRWRPLSISSLGRALRSTRPTPCSSRSVLGTTCLMAPCILEAQIPCLASRTWLQDVEAVIDMNHEVYMGLFQVTLPLVLINGHLGLDVSNRSLQEPCFEFWHSQQPELFRQCREGQRMFVS